VDDDDSEPAEFFGVLSAAEEGADRLEVRVEGYSALAFRLPSRTAFCARNRIAFHLALSAQEGLHMTNAHLALPAPGERNRQ
jgi:hypothetical protein